MGKCPLMKINNNKKKWNPAATHAGPGVMVGRSAANFAPFVLTGGHKGRGPRLRPGHSITSAELPVLPGELPSLGCCPRGGMAPGRLPVPESVLAEGNQPSGLLLLQ